ncbi:efflux transporter periplasmic adaptor subunit [Chlorobaculum limnaeum]|uniref:Efflux transporter periplasmic adaptor subunit n=1 Tax=Chlorobaculum limnaeum TaxID=274537 RepID=A0A1D8D5L3_CHLLM|nr:efflux RND transporter periplasmic adaptor subunit [Chlorobaculum limnaeum]AOS83814.1 efflux transporter periplasmic adaptor subunit [Chlorobaculum limnaeum]
MKPLSKTQRIVAISSVVFAFLLFLVLRPAPLPVDAGAASYGPLEVSLEEEGVTRVIDRFTVSAPVNGKVRRSELVEGDSVNAGMTVAAILPPDQNAREYRESAALAGSATASVTEAFARQREVSVRLAQARLKAGRYERLHREGAVSKESSELAAEAASVLEKEARAASAAVEAARMQASAAAARIDTGIASKAVEARSPVDGKVLRILEKNERFVPAGTPLVEIGNPGLLEVVIDVLSSDAVRIRPGNRVVVEDWGGGGALVGAVRRIEPAAFTKISALGIEEKRVNIIAMLDRPEPRLGDNFRIQARIVTSQASRVLRVPVSALFRGEGGWELFVIENGRARARKVKIGMRGADMAEVLGGLRAGERVVTHPPNELQEGMRVAVQGK